jgi:death-on-curing protein
VRYLSEAEVVEIHRRVVEQSGGLIGIRDRGALDSSVTQPSQSFAGEDLYVGPVSKAAALSFFLATNHPFVDGNKRVAHAALEVTLVLNGYELRATVDEQERIMLRLASGELSRAEFSDWVERHTHSSGA